jgi:DNA-binding NarL/FixJ family response regulator/signal transduction histidine kinase
MTTLNGFYLNQYALSFLAQLILTLAALLYFYRMVGRIKEVWPVGFFFVAMAGNVAIDLLAATAVWTRYYYLTHFRYVLLFLVLFAAVETAYRFPFLADEPFTRQRKRELPVVSAFFVLAVVLVLLWAIYQTSQLRPGGAPSANPRFLNLVVVACLLWALVTILRRLYALANQTTPRRWGWRHLPGPVRSMYELLGVFLFTLPLAAIIALSSFGVLPAWWQQLVPAVGLTIILFLLSVTLLDATVETTTFMLRLIGPVLLVIFLALGVVGVIIAQTYSRYVDVRPAALPAQTIRFEPQSPENYAVTTVPVQLDADWGETVTADTVTLPFAFPFFEQNRSEVALNEAGVLAFGPWSEALYRYNRQPALAVYQQQERQPWRTFVNNQAGQTTVTWQAVEAEKQVVQVVLYADGRFDFNYPVPLDGRNLKRIGFQSGSGGAAFTPFRFEQTIVGGDGLLADYEILHHQALHPLMVPLAYLIVIAGLLTILGFPLLFRTILVQPLNALVSGVQAINAGDLEVQVPVYSQDEIGLVTSAFNQMVRTIHQSEQSLEARVEERSQALAESERRLGALEERDRIGREIHDDLGQVMGYVHLQVEAALTRLRRGETSQTEGILTDVGRVAQEAHDNVRQYILGIRTSKKVSPGITFWQALDEYLALVSNRYELEIELTGAAELEALLQLTPAVETQLLRMIQEGITNIHKHAQATRVQLVLTLQEEWLQLLLKDNGRGFDPDTSAGEGHFGLQIMRERAESVNGRLAIISTPGQGTQIQIQVPCLIQSQATAAVPQSPWRVLLVDDHALFREGLANMLRPHGLQIVGVAENGREGERLAAGLQPDLILMDIHMPEQDGLETTRRIKEHFPHIKVVMLTMAAEEALLLAALKNGASGYLLKNLPAAPFLTLLNKVMAGKTIVSPDLATQVLTMIAQADTAPKTLAEQLSPRQQEVLAYLAQGMNNKQIAEQLVVSESTVKFHIRQIMERLGLQTRHELIRYELEKTRLTQKIG